MSGFDFGTLRDPDAPQPDSHHRDAVEARAHELRAKTRRNRTLLSGLALVVVIAAVAGIVATRPNPDPSIEVTNPSSTTTAPTPSSSIDRRFIPPTTMENGSVVLPATFPDGETTTLRYPPEMKIAQLGYAGEIGVSGTRVQIEYTTIAHRYLDSKPLAEYRDANGATVPVFQGYRQITIQGPPPPDEMAFQFGPWLAWVSLEGKTDAQRAIWARSLTGTVDARGYLLLHAASPLSLGNVFLGGFGVGPGNVVELGAHLACGQPESDTSARRRFTDERGSAVSWCAGDLHLTATGTKSFADLAASQLQVTGPLSSASTTTSTTLPTSRNTPAVSASFISPTHGWVLQRDGSVAATADGGLNWKTVGSVGDVGGYNYRSPQLRFADATHGFAHTDRDLFATGDGGMHWQRLDVPFGRVEDLAISRGVVYLVALDERTNIFSIWSSPTDRLAWSKDPLTLPIGGGPVPVQQLVFSGGNGWVTNGDRGLMGGARMSASGRWETWQPPCLGAYASLAASSATEMAAVCAEGVWTGPKITNSVYFSHDGGATFQRHDAPAYGEISSPDATSAVVNANGVLRRTTDEGATWNEVAREPGSSDGLDLGFTTATQGFVIFGDGKMLMTHDAGATWSAVTLP
jgi:photosystem II stability/assembly factor-like uncharacterized protein